MDLAIEDMKKNNYNSYFKKAGQKIVDLNDQAVDLGVSAAVKVEIPASWADAQDTPVAEPKGVTPFVRDIVLPHGPSAGRQAACLCVPEVRRAGRHLGERHLRLLQARRSRARFPSGTAASASSATAAPCACPHAAIRPCAADRGREEQRCPPVSRPCPPRVWARILPTPSGCRCLLMTALAAACA